MLLESFIRPSYQSWGWKHSLWLWKAVMNRGQTAKKFQFFAWFEMNVYLEQNLSQFSNLCTRKNNTFPFWKYSDHLVKAFHNYFAWEKGFYAFNIISPQHGSATSNCCNTGSNGIYCSRIWSNFKFTLTQ